MAKYAYLSTPKTQTLLSDCWWSIAVFTFVGSTTCYPIIMPTLLDFFCKSTKDYCPIERAIAHQSLSSTPASSDLGDGTLPPPQDQTAVTKEPERYYDAAEIDMATKVEVVKYTEIHSVPKATRQYPGLKSYTIRRWMAAVQLARNEALKRCPDGAAVLEFSYEDALLDKRAANGRNVPEAALQKAFDRFVSAREEGVAVTTELLRQIVLAEVRAVAPEIVYSADNEAGWFRCSDTWLRKWKADNQIRRRAVTTARRSDVDADALRAKFLHRVAYVAQLWGISPELCYHADETGVQLNPAATKTLDFVGEKSVEVIGAGDKRQVTLMLGGTVAGEVLVPQIVFEGKTSRVLPPAVNGAVYAFTANHWASFDTTIQWLSAVLVPHALAKKACMGLPPDAPCVLIWDVWLHHKSQAMLDYIQQYYPWIKLVFVPASTTSKLQVADVAMNGPFKAHIRNSHSQHMLECLESTENLNASVSAMHELLVNWTISALKHAQSIGAVANGARKVGLTGCFTEDMAFESKVAHMQGDLWISNSRKDTVAINGNANACVTAADQEDDSDNDSPQLVIPTIAMTEVSSVATGSTFSSGQKRRRRQVTVRCSHCLKQGHNRATCPARAARKAQASAAAAHEQ